MGSRTRERYKGVREQIKEGKNLLIDPLDYRILEQLPEVGTLMGGLVPIGETVRNIHKHAFKGVVDHTVVGGRMNALRSYGFAVPVRIAAGNKQGRGWQITPEGKAALLEWQSRQKEDE